MSELEELEEIDMGDFCFEEDDVLSHTANDTVKFFEGNLSRDVGPLCGLHDRAI